MDFCSTRSTDKVSAKQAIQLGLAKDGGLFVPTRWPQVIKEPGSLAQIAHQVLSPFFQPCWSDDEISEFCHQAFNFKVPIVEITKNTFQLELFHGPTAAFKDFGARFLGQLISGQEKKSVILVATSGDTGGAVASAMDGLENVEVVLLFPEGKVSPLQKQQLTCWSDNIHSFSVQGNFDDCQKMVKQAFAHYSDRESPFTSANSISVGRLLPQMVYYAYSSIEFFDEHKKKANYIVPTGNMGNVVAALYARRLGFPINEIAISTNSNQTLQHYFETQEYKVFDLEQTLANAMDVADPSNFERYMRIQERVGEPLINKCRSVSDSEIRSTIQRMHKNNGVIVCPHTATGFCFREELDDQPWIVVSTAHAAKFNDVIVPALGVEAEMPECLLQLQSRKSRYQTIPNNSRKFIDRLSDYCL